jgi:hypothetical protein
MRKEGLKMKHISFLILLLLSLQTMAQVMVIHRSGFPDSRIPIASIRKVTFYSLGAAAMHPTVFRRVKECMARIIPSPRLTNIAVKVERPSRVKIQVFDMNGRIVNTIVDRNFGVGHHIIRWNRCDFFGRRLGSAPYVVNVLIGGTSVSKTLILTD